MNFQDINISLKIKSVYITKEGPIKLFTLQNYHNKQANSLIPHQDLLNRLAGTAAVLCQAPV